MPARPVPPDTLCTCVRCIAIDCNGILIPRREWLMHVAATNFQYFKGSSPQDPAIRDDLYSTAFSVALSDGQTCNATHPPPSNAHPHATTSVTTSAEHLFRAASQPTQGCAGLNPSPSPPVHSNLEQPMRPASDYTESAGLTGCPPYAPKTSVRGFSYNANKNIHALNLIHHEIQGLLNLIGPSSDETTHPAKVLSFLEPAIVKLDDLSARLSGVTSRHLVVAKRKAEIVADFAILENRIQGWKNCYPDFGPREYDTDHCYYQRAASVDPAVQVALLIGVACRVLFGMGRNGCNLIMQFLFIFANTLLGFPPDARDDPRVQRIPLTIETAEHHFNLEPRTTIYAACPNCHWTYAPSESANKAPHYPSTCDHQQSPELGECGALLLDQDGEPLRTFEYHHLEDWIATLLCNPTLENHIRRFCDKTLQSCRGPAPTILNDVSDGHFWRTFMGHDGKHFLDGGSEVRIALAISIDYFSTEGITRRGQTTCGIISAACLNLPAEIRYDAANMYVAGIIPGPTHLKHGEEEGFVRPLIDDLVSSFKRGTRYSKTASCPDGCVARSAAASVVADFPAGRSLTGSHEATSHHYCTICQCENVSSRHRTDFENWVNRDPKVLRELAERYSGLTQKERRHALELTGVKSSGMWRLPYWNPVKQLAVDPMHCLLERVCQRYTREILSLSPEAPKQQHLYPAFFWEFRSPFVRSAQGSKDVFPQSDIQPEDALGIDLALEFPEYVGSQAEEELRQILQDTSIGWRNAVPLIHNLLTDPLHNSIAAANELVEALEKKQLNALVYVCADLGLPIHGYESLPKLHFAIKLCNWRLEFPLDPLQDHKGLNAADALDHLRDVITKTIRPSNIASIPNNYGDLKNGTMKADQWKTLWRLYIPLTLVTLWGQGSPIRSQNADTKTNLLVNAMALAGAVAIACRRSITLEQANAYREMFRVHIEGLKRMFPHFKFSSQHLAFHLYDFFLLFGPAKSWWCFPFERLVGKLQRVPHNHKFGELESTMLHTFVQGSRLKQWLFRDDSPPAIQVCKRLFRDTRDSFENRSGGDVFYRRNCPVQLKNLIGAATVDETSHIYRHGVSYSNCRHHSGNCLVLIEHGDAAPIPASIEHILLIDGLTCVAIRQMIAAPAGTRNPFDDFPFIEGAIFSSRLSYSMELIPCSRILGHFAMYPMTRDLTAIISLLQVNLDVEYVATGSLIYKFRDSTGWAYSTQNE